MQRIQTVIHVIVTGLLFTSVVWGEILYRHDDDQYIIQPDGTGNRLLTNGLWARWSPDGVRVAVMEIRDHDPHLSVINADSTGREYIAPGDVPSWSPDGLKLAYFRSRNIYVWDFSTKQEVDLGPGERPVWSSDGQQLVFGINRGMDADDLYIMNIDGTDRRKILEGGHTIRECPPSPFSPRGMKLLVGTCYDHYFCIQVLDIETLALRMIAPWGDAASWSPDGSMVVYSHPGDYDHGWNGIGLYLVDPVEAESRVLLEGHSNWVPKWPTWSPDGSRIAFCIDEKDRWIYVINADGSGLQKLAAGWLPQWSPAASGGSSTSLPNVSWGALKNAVDGSNRNDSSK